MMAARCVASSLSRTLTIPRHESSRVTSRICSQRLLSSSSKPKLSNPPASARTTAGSGKVRNETDPHAFARERGPVSWPALGLVAVTAASLVAYYRIERERRLEEAMGKIVSSESDGWSPNPEFLGKRKYQKTKYGWFPVDDAYGAGEPILVFVSIAGFYRLLYSLICCIPYLPYSQQTCDWWTLVLG